MILAAAAALANSQTLAGAFCLNIAGLLTMRGEPNEAWLSCAREWLPEDRRIALLAGYRAVQRGKAAEAEALFTESLQSSRSGLAYYRLSKLAEAEGDASRQILLGAQASPHLLHSLGSEAVAHERWDLILSSFPEVLKILPGDPLANRTYGLALYRGRKDYSTAAVYLQQALELDPLDRETYLSLVDLYREQGDFDQAARWLNLAWQRFPDWDEIAIEQSRLMAAEGAVEQAVNLLSTYVQANPDCGLCYFWMGEFLAGQEKVNEALVRYRQAVERLPLNVWTKGLYFRLAEAEEMAGNPGRAFEIYHLILSMEPDEIQAISALARLEEQAK